MLPFTKPQNKMKKMQEVTASLATAKEASMDAALAADFDEMKSKERHWTFYFILKAFPNIFFFLGSSNTFVTSSAASDSKNSTNW